MSAFNEIQVKIVCPVCREQTEAIFQLHLAASFSGDEQGRFHRVKYQIGDCLRWWDPSNPRYEPWKTEDGIDFGGGFAECCLGECPVCQSALYAVIVVKDLHIEKIAEVGLERDRPADFPM